MTQGWSVLSVHWLVIQLFCRWKIFKIEKQNKTEVPILQGLTVYPPLPVYWWRGDIESLFHPNLNRMGCQWRDKQYLLETQNKTWFTSPRVVVVVVREVFLDGSILELRIERCAQFQLKKHKAEAFRLRDKRSKVTQPELFGDKDRSAVPGRQ